ncbi:MAG: secretion system protein E [Candidatus Aenigmarchaeota archaeon]|nr:secretion system protein E [Candidatus Aenigmarchaeota archaeon]
MAKKKSKKKHKVSKKKRELPKFKIFKRRPKALPEVKKIRVRYALIPPFAGVNIKWNEEEKEVIYNVSEPKLSEKERQIKDKLVNGLLEVLDIELSAIKKKGEAIEYLESHVKNIIDEYQIKLSKRSYLKIMYYIFRDFIGLNEIEPMLQDPYIEDISCVGVGIPIYVVHRKYGSIKTNIIYDNIKQLTEFVVKIAERCGRFISYAEPLLDGSLPDGSRVQASFAEDVTTRGPSFTIRKFVQIPLSPVDLMNRKTVNSEILAYLWLAVESGASILIAGGAGTGKTTLLNVISMFIPPTAKIVTIEDTRELNLTHENWIPAVTRVSFMKGVGEVSMFDLLKTSFRQTPDYVIVGEVRGKEAYVMFQGMASGIPAIGTMHAGRVEDVIYRLETPPIELSPALVDTLDLVLVMVHAREKGESERRLKEIDEIQSVDPETGKPRQVRYYYWLPDKDDFGKYAGDSWLLQELSRNKGQPLTSLKKEIERRKALLEWMQKKKITFFKDVAAVLSEYYKDPKKILERARIIKKVKRKKKLKKRTRKKFRKRFKR